MTNQEIDLKLLETDVPALVHKYQYKIKIIVNNFVKQHFFKKEEAKDVVQNVNECLLVKAPTMQRQYNHKATVSTYISTIIKNICLQHIRKLKRQPVSTSIEATLLSASIPTAFSHNSYSNQLTIEQEAQKLRHLIQGFGSSRGKLELMLRLVCRLPIDENTITACFPHCPEIYLGRIIEDLSVDYQQKTDKKIYHIYTYYANLIEGRSRIPDAIKKWTEYKLHQIIDSLNQSSTTANYDKEALKILIAMYYLKFKEFENLVSKSNSA